MTSNRSKQVLLKTVTLLSAIVCGTNSKAAEQLTQRNVRGDSSMMVARCMSRGEMGPS